MNPYEVLGVSPKATKAQIKKAYRKATLKTHPDRGGTSEAYQQVQLAHDVLMDDERRAKYDTTGVIDEDKPTQEGEQVDPDILRVILPIYDQITRQACDSDTLTKIDIPALMRVKLDDIRSRLLTGQAQFTKTLLKLEKMLGRFKTTEPYNLLESFVKQDLQKVNNELVGIAEQLSIVEKCLKYVQTYKYDFKDDRLSKPGEWRTAAPWMTFRPSGDW